MSLSRQRPVAVADDEKQPTPVPGVPPRAILGNRVHCMTKPAAHYLYEKLSPEDGGGYLVTSRHAGMLRSWGNVE